MLRHVKNAHRELIRKERENQEALDRDGLLSHLNSTLTQTNSASVQAATSKQPEPVSVEADKSLRRVNSSDCNVRRQSVYARPSPVGETESGSKSIDSSSSVVDKITSPSSIVFNVTYKTPTRSAAAASTPRKTTPNSSTNKVRSPGRKLVVVVVLFI